MAERRSLIDGINTPPAEVEQDFVYGGKPKPTAAPQATTAPTATPQISRVPLSTRIRTEYSQALKRASLERQLNSVEPSTLQDILEEAVEPWLRSNGYLD